MKRVKLYICRTGFAKDHQNLPIYTVELKPIYQKLLFFTERSIRIPVFSETLSNFRLRSLWL